MCFPLLSEYGTVAIFPWVADVGFVPILYLAAGVNDDFSVYHFPGFFDAVSRPSSVEDRFVDRGGESGMEACNKGFV